MAKNAMGTCMCVGCKKWEWMNGGCAEWMCLCRCAGMGNGCVFGCAGMLCVWVCRKGEWMCVCRCAGMVNGCTHVCGGVKEGGMDVCVGMKEGGMDVCGGV